MRERFRVQPDEIIVFKSGETVRVTVHCNIKPKMVRVKNTNNKYHYEDWFEAECNSFTAHVDDIDWNLLFSNPNKYLDFESTMSNM